jgi:hypothetical protein
MLDTEYSMDNNRNNQEMQRVKTLRDTRVSLRGFAPVSVAVQTRLYAYWYRW